MTDEKALRIAEPVVKEVVDCLAEKRYDCIENYADFENGWSAGDMKEFIEGCLEVNELSHIDKYGIPCNFSPDYEYNQLSVYVSNNGKSFVTNYDLTTDSEINDFMLIMRFVVTDSGKVKAYLTDVHIL
ncbi:MAG: hypothetical protein NC177_03135 [Ruminococcus flavefaciens]|nr:hypothetical protein [Ruminococcus flavefaciens]